MGLLELCEKYFETKNLYEILGISEKATEKDVKKAYHKLSLKVHPDRVKEDEKLEATEKFKVLGGIHSILSDANKRAAYDETGTIDEDDIEVDENKDWTVYWRLLFKKITDEDIRNYEKEYVGSQEERVDLKKAYLAGKGDMDYIVDHVQFARSEQEPRLRDILNEMIESKEVPAFKVFTHEPEKKRKRRHAKEMKEAEEAEEFSKEMGLGNGTDDLALMIKEKQEARGKALDSFIDGLTAKYGGAEAKPKANKRKAAPRKVTQEPENKRRTRSTK
ncbi:dnaJ homolog subfamily C member 9 [Plutella xylostella]|uniref:dnaJ homolog subfamily C member 9 n=1 Tax=Plutella xylostella TaxID=51655 RepID=UPI002032671C|nr:dnaJ homolog subfamily C member 9 [Plutella xylostella]